MKDSFELWSLFLKGPYLDLQIHNRAGVLLIRRSDSQFIIKQVFLIDLGLKCSFILCLSLKCINILFYVLLKSWPNLEVKQFTIGFDSWFGWGTPFLFFFFCPIRFTIWTIVIMVFNIKFLNLKSTSTKTSLRVVHVCFGLMLGFWFCRNFCSLSCDSDSMSRDSLWISCFASTLWEKSLFFAYDFGICSLTHSPTGDLSQHLYFRFPFPFFIRIHILKAVEENLRSLIQNTTRLVVRGLDYLNIPVVWLYRI